MYTIINSYVHVSFYKSEFDKFNFSPYEFNNVDQLQKLPILERGIINKNFHRIFNPRIDKRLYKTHYTSGSTGNKLKFFIPYDLSFAKNAAFTYRFYSFLDVRVGDRRITIGGRIFTNRSPYWTYNRVENQLLLSSHHLNTHTVFEYLKKIKEFKPIFIQG